MPSCGCTPSGWVRCTVQTLAGARVDSIEVEGLAGRSGPITPGQYTLHVRGREVATVEVPVVVRLEGTNVDQGRELLASSGLDIIAADDLTEAAKKAAAVVA